MVEGNGEEEEEEEGKRRDAACDTISLDAIIIAVSFAVVALLLNN